MNGYLTQIFGDNIEELYWTSVEIEEEIIKTAYKNYREEDNEDSFEDWWNFHNTIQIERVFVNMVWV